MSPAHGERLVVVPKKCSYHTSDLTSPQLASTDLISPRVSTYPDVSFTPTNRVIGPIPWGHSGPLCHALSLLLSLWTSILHCHSPGAATVARRLRYSYSWLWLILVVVSTVATPGEWRCQIRTGGVRRLAVANGPNIFQMLLVYLGDVSYQLLCV